MGLCVRVGASVENMVKSGHSDTHCVCVCVSVWMICVVRFGDTQSHVLNSIHMCHTSSSSLYLLRIITIAVLGPHYHPAHPHSPAHRSVRTFQHLCCQSQMSVLDAPAASSSWAHCNEAYCGWC